MPVISADESFKNDKKKQPLHIYLDGLIERENMIAGNDEAAAERAERLIQLAKFAEAIGSYTSTGVHCDFLSSDKQHKIIQALQILEHKVKNNETDFNKNFDDIKENLIEIAKNTTIFYGSKGDAQIDGSVKDAMTNIGWRVPKEVADNFYVNPTSSTNEFFKNIDAFIKNNQSHETVALSADQANNILKQPTLSGVSKFTNYEYDSGKAYASAILKLQEADPDNAVSTAKQLLSKLSRDDRAIVMKNLEGMEGGKDLASDLKRHSAVHMGSAFITSRGELDIKVDKSFGPRR